MTILKLAFTSDLHLPIAKDETISALGREVQAFAPQAFVVAGDVGESLADLKRGLQLLREQVRCPIWVLAGNHDVWARPPHDSRQLWLEQVPATVRAAGCHYLEGTSFVLDGVAVIVFPGRVIALQRGRGDVSGHVREPESDGLVA